MPLLLPDAPVVAWWPGEPPGGARRGPDRHARPAPDHRRRVGRAAARGAADQRASSYRPGDTDLAWTRLTLWRGLLASALDQPPHETITSVMVAGASDSPSTDLLAGWLAMRLRCPVTRRKTRGGRRHAERRR